MSSRRVVLTWLCFVVALGWFHSSGMAAPWRVYNGPTLVMLSDADETLARRRIENLEHFRTAMIAYMGEASATRLPTRLLYFGNHREFGRHEADILGKKSEFDGFYYADRFQNLIAADAEEDVRNLGQVLRHEFVHLLCRAQQNTWPFWLREGIAECLSTAAMGTNEVVLGIPPKGSLNSVNYLTRPPLRELITASDESIRALSGERLQAYYGESWLLTHLLVFNAKRENAGKADQFLKLITDGASTTNALKLAYGWSPMNLASEVARYQSRGRFKLVKLHLTNAAPVAIAVRPASPGEFNHWLGHWLLAGNRTNEAAVQFQLSEKAEPGSALSEFGLGLSEQRLGRFNLSVDHLRTARAKDPRNYEILFHLAWSLTLDSERLYLGPVRPAYTPNAEICDLLLECLLLRPDFVPAYDLLGRVEHARGHLQKATDALVKAITLATFEDSTRLELARVLRDGKRPELARVQFQLVASNPRNKLAATEAAADLARMDSKPEPAPK